MTEVRELKVSFRTSGNGYKSPFICLPKKWTDELNIGDENREVIVTFQDGKIIIEKK